MKDHGIIVAALSLGLLFDFANKGSKDGIKGVFAIKISIRLTRIAKSFSLLQISCMKTNAVPLRECASCRGKRKERGLLIKDN